MLRLKTILIFGFLLMGFTFTVTQGLMIRELLVVFFGNELSIGLILGNWLILEAIGSGLLGRLTERWVSKPSTFAALEILFALLLPFCLYAAYNSGSLIGAIPGEGVGLLPIFWSTFLVLAPLALVDGAMFPFGSRAFAAVTGREVHSIGRVYVYESLGAIIGGIVFTYLFIPYLYSLQIVLLLSGLNLFAASLIFSSYKLLEGERLPLKLGIVVALVLLVAGFGFSLSPGAEHIQRWASSRQWTGLNLIYSENSVYGNVAVVQRESQYTFYADGIPILTAPEPDRVLSEEIVHLPMLFILHPERVLVLSGGVGGVLSELSKYPLQRIDYAELDPLLIEAVEEFPTMLTLDELNNPRLRVEHVDGRLLVRKKAWNQTEIYDLIIINLPYPSTLQLNRFYTVEFFQMVRGLLSENGVLVMGTPGTLTYMSEELRDLNKMAYQTLKRVTSHVRPIPGDSLTWWLASEAEGLLTTPLEVLIARWEERGLESRLMTSPYIRQRLDQAQLDWFWQALGEEDEGGRSRFLGGVGEHLNQDLHPVGLFYGLSYWHALFSPSLVQLFALTGQLNLWPLSLFIIGCSLLLTTVVRLTKRGRGIVIPYVVATTGFSGMAADLVLIFAFQSLYGYVYHWIGLFITAFMAGLSLGGFLMNRRLDRIRSDKRPLIALDFAIVIYWGLTFTLFNFYHTQPFDPLILAFTQGLLLVLNALGGFLVGSQFPLANKILSRERKGLKGTAGFLYASDLTGAFLGSITVSVILIPALGILSTCLLASIIKMGSLLLIAFLPSRS